MKNNIKIDFKIKLAVYPILLFVLIYLIINFVIQPTITDIKETRFRIAEQDADLDKRYDRARSLKRMTQKLEKIQPQIKKMDKIFININQELEFITTVEGLAVNNNVEQNIKLGTLSAPDKKTAIASMPVELRISGTFYDVLSYLLDLEALDYYVNISKLSLSSSPAKTRLSSAESAPNEPNVSMTLTAVSYWK